MYLRVPRLIFFSLTLALSAATLGLEAWGLHTGIEKKKLASKTIPGAKLIIGDLLGIGGAVIAAAGVGSIICLGLFAEQIFFRGKWEETPRRIRLKEGLYAFSAIFWIATLIPATIITATRSGKVVKPGVPQSVIDGLVSLSGQDLRYKSQDQAKDYLYTGWLAFLANMISLVLAAMASRHVHKHGLDGTGAGAGTRTRDTEGTNALTAAETAHGKPSLEKSLHSPVQSEGQVEV
ncbi:hypothetical protein MNV49_006151 [Pseudohyphozyma bogoriensis]|nr:hypothetical protein MNV49_006151 [Pseudohyphozyma bogoriensis]